MEAWEMTMTLEQMPVGPGRVRTASVLECLAEAVRHDPGRTAIIHAHGRLAYGSLAQAVVRLQGHLAARRSGTGPVAVVMPNTAELTVAAFASWGAGAQVALLNPSYTAHELRPLLTGAAPSCLVAYAGREQVVVDLARELDVPVLVLGTGELELELLAADPDPAAVDRLGTVTPDLLATMMFTGGTTGVPKAVNHTHASLMATVQGMEACWPTTFAEETWLNVAPLFHIWGLLMGMLNPIHGAATVITVPQFDPPAIVAAFEEHGVTVFSGGPAEIYAGLLKAPNFAGSDLSRLRVCPGGGSRFAPALLDRWRSATGAYIYEAFGMTEIAPIACNPWGRQPRPGSVGLAAPLIELSIVDLLDPLIQLPTGSVGEIAVRAPHLTTGYHGHPDSEQWTPEGWFLTGDIGRLDEDGYLSILDRKKEMLLVGGFNVYPREIDETLMAHPAVLEAATIGIDDDRKGQRPVSFVVLAEGADPDTDLYAQCEANLIGYKRPVAIVLARGMLPRTPANKIDRRGLALLWQSEGSTD
ncbi:long-chain fatty acid--CoA ligase [Pimelobacter simplex]|uniref:Long-chain fatty acid--CoA ligase n=2 Tax=Nocardioides simplex TaxID=2045 RepID=A0A7J5DYC0_NOCSI|nr:long-chain fatty acid--CoA ligase [Pimelobacter simplex]